MLFTYAVFFSVHKSVSKMHLQLLWKYPITAALVCARERFPSIIIIIFFFSYYVHVYLLYYYTRVAATVTTLLLLFYTLCEWVPVGKWFLYTFSLSLVRTMIVTIVLVSIITIAIVSITVRWHSGVEDTI